MQIDEALIAKIVRAVIAALRSQGLLNEPDGSIVPEYGCGVPRPHMLPGTRPAASRPGNAVMASGGRRAIVTEETVREHLKNGIRRLTVPANALITPLAADTAREKGLQLVRGGAAS